MERRLAEEIEQKSIRETEGDFALAGRGIVRDVIPCRDGDCYNRGLPDAALAA
jgi:hypothetical protein